MTEAKAAHTAGLAPAPWKVGNEGQMWTDSLSIIDADGGEIAYLTRGYEGDENGDGCPSWKNARLIAASPKMLEALRMLTAATQNLIDNWYPDVDQDTARKAAQEEVLHARSAIAAASGDSKL